MMHRELETLNTLRRELGCALKDFAEPLGTTMRLFAAAKETPDRTPERWAEIADACEATLREVRRVTRTIEFFHEALVRKSHGDRPTLPGYQHASRPPSA